jgi:hypothetical protein
VPALGAGYQPACQGKIQPVRTEAEHPDRDHGPERGGDQADHDEAQLHSAFMRVGAEKSAVGAQVRAGACRVAFCVAVEEALEAAAATGDLLRRRSHSYQREPTDANQHSACFREQAGEQITLALTFAADEYEASRHWLSKRLLCHLGGCPA